MVQKELMASYKDILFADAADMDLKRDNANIDTDAPMGIMLKLGAESAKSFVDECVLDEEARKADKENWIHIHDKDFSLITFNCCQIDLAKLLKDGFSTGHGFLREPNSIRSAASLACIAIQSNQNDMFGGQSISTFDFAMAPYVAKSFQKHLKKNFHKMYLAIVSQAYFEHKTQFQKISAEQVPGFLSLRYKEGPFTGGCIDSERESEVFVWEDEHKEYLSTFNKHDRSVMQNAVQNAYNMSCIDVEDEVKQAMEAVIHNFNTLHSRAGAQVPFSSLNFGCDTSPEGRLVIDKLLDAEWDGLGHGETPIFPITVFQLKAGINYNKEDKNYDLFQKAIKVSAKRLFPNFVNVDAPYNLQYYREGDPKSLIATMGCRTRVISNVNGPEECGSRGNFAFTTINLPKLAIESYLAYPKDEKARIKHFYSLFDKYIGISRRYLEQRYQIIANKKGKNFPFLLGQHVWMGSEEIGPEDSIEPVLKHASISIGFCGLAECLKELIGQHHGESEKAQKLGLEIVGHLRKRTDAFTDETHMNWSTFGTPAESTAGQFHRANQKAYGEIPGVTDRAYMTNSSHVPVYYPIKAIDKIRIEAPYHALENAGHIAYIELDGDTTKNVKAFETVIRAMHDANMGYFSINHPVDRDPICGYTGIIENECPHCHRMEVEHGHFTVKRAE